MTSVLPFFRLGARTGLGLALIVITWLALVPGPPVPFDAWDKLNHVMAFFVLSMLGDYAFPGLTWRKPVFACLLVYGVVLELLQSLTGYRYPELWDVFADGVGIVAFMALRPAVNHFGVFRQFHTP
jgi:VanZ family protein